MIDRYSLPEMTAIWELQNKYDTWLKVELAIVEAQAEIGRIPREAADQILKNATFTLERALEIEQWVAPDLPEVGHTLVRLGSVLHALGDYPAAVRAFEEARTVYARHPQIAAEANVGVLNNLGVVFADAGDPERAAGVLRDAVEQARAVYGDHHPTYATAVMSLANCLAGFAILDLTGRADVSWPMATIIALMAIFTAMNSDIIGTSNRKLRALVREASLTDPLTGLANRRMFREVLDGDSPGGR